MADSEGDIYSATYSNVPVYELKIGNEHVMMRRSDQFINATHILKIAGFDKPARTRILEREVQKGVHEKIQGGYGKYQGTWIPLSDGRLLAERNGVLPKLRKVFEFVPGDRSPPPAPKHQTATAAKPKAPKATAASRKSHAINAQTTNHQNMNSMTHARQQDFYPAEDQYDGLSTQFTENETPVEQTPPSSPLLDDDNLYQFSQTSTGSKKRKRGPDFFSEEEMGRIAYGDELLDYFITSSDENHTARDGPPLPPPGFHVDQAIDTHGNNALHWACSMGDLQVIRELLARNANPVHPTDIGGETPLMRAVIFTNNFDKHTFPKLVNMLAGTIMERDFNGSTVFHHIAQLALSRSKWSCCRYYCEVLINKLKEQAPQLVPTILGVQDKDHDTAVLCAVRNGCMKVATFLLTHCAEAGDIPNLKGETANELLRTLSSRNQSLEVPPSSPIQPGESIGRRSKRRSDLSKIPTVSRAASTVLTKIGPIMEEASTRLAMMYDAEMREKQTLITESQNALADLESQRHRIRQETYALMAKADQHQSPEKEMELRKLRNSYEAKLVEVQSLLEQVEHASLQQEILAEDTRLPAVAFKSNNPNFVSQEEMRAMIPWAKELYQQQLKRRDLVSNVATLMGERGDSERIGVHRSLVAMATGIREDELDVMSGEIFESLDGNISLIRTPDGPHIGAVDGIAL